MNVGGGANGTSEPLAILLVDDDQVDRLIVRRLLRNDGARVQVTEVADAEAALVQVQSNRFDCVVLDYQMPARDGLWLLQTMRERGSGLPVVMLTGQGDERTAVELMKAGAADYLPKAALAGDRLIQSVRQAVRVHRAERETQAAMSALEEERQRLRLALDATGLGTWEWDVPHNRLRWDARCRQLMELGPDVEVSPERDFYPSIHPEDLPRVQEEIDRCFRGQSSSYDIEYRARSSRSRTPKWVRATGRVYFEGSRPVRFSGTVEDITPRKRFEEELRRQAEFEQQLLGIVSHDLRNPISAMMMSASVLLRREDTTERFAKPLARILSSGERATRMIRDLLDFSQARAGGGIPINREAFDLHPFARQTLDEVQLNFPDRRIEFTSVGDGQGEWDADRVAQMLTNLVGNALAYSPPDTPVRVRSRGEGTSVALEVQNDGEPIDPELLPVLFEPFKRGRGPHSPHRNIGLGLYIVKQLVLAHGGTIEVQSERPTGTLFRIRMPRWATPER